MLVPIRYEIIGILGRDIGYSLSPDVHNPVFREFAPDSVYLPLDTSDPGAVLDAADRLGLRGLSVTIPHKEAVAPHCRELDSAAREIGAVNTLLRRDGAWFGFNTDGPAIVRVLERLDPERGTLLVLGSGGVARAVAWAARQLGYRGVIAGRNRETTTSIASDFGLETCDWDARRDVRAGVVVNATPLGSTSARKATPFDVPYSSATRCLFDTVYVPHRTRFLDEGERAGLRVAHGLEMFLDQAAEQSRLFTGVDRRDRFTQRFEELTELARSRDAE